MRVTLAIVALGPLACGVPSRPVPAAVAPPSPELVPEPPPPPAPRVAPSPRDPDDGDDEPVAVCDDPDPDMYPDMPEHDGPSPDGWIVIEAVVFRAGCISEDKLRREVGAHDAALVACFVAAGAGEHTVNLRTEWVRGWNGPMLERTELRPVRRDDDAPPPPSQDAPPPPVDDAALQSCLEGELAKIDWLGGDPTLPTIVDLELSRGATIMRGP